MILKEDFIASILNDGVSDFIMDTYPEITDLPTPEANNDSKNLFVIASYCVEALKGDKYLSGKPIFDFLLRGTQRSASSVGLLMASLVGEGLSTDYFTLISPMNGLESKKHKIDFQIIAPAFVQGVHVALSSGDSADMSLADGIWQASLVLSTGENTATFTSSSIENYSISSAFTVLPPSYSMSPIDGDTVPSKFTIAIAPKEDLSLDSGGISIFGGGIYVHYDLSIKDGQLVGDIDLGLHPELMSQAVEVIADVLFENAEQIQKTITLTSTE